jgi:hypothetical protein
MTPPTNSASNTPTPLALTTTSASAASSSTRRSASGVASYTTERAQTGASMSRWLCRSNASGS